jgi:hypothetical protein
VPAADRPDPVELGEAQNANHAVSGDPAAIAGYLGSGDRFDQSIAEFAMRYADQNESDHDAFVTAIRDGPPATAGAEG